MSDELIPSEGIEIIPPHQLSIPQSTEVRPVVLTDSEILEIMEQWPSFSITRDDETGEMILHLEGRRIGGGTSVRDLMNRFANLDENGVVREFTKKRYAGLPTTPGVKQTIIKKGPHGHSRNRLGA
jgi:hypothetical protein